MSKDFLPDNPYLLLTPGPLSTSKAVKAAMLRDWCTWDEDYNLEIVQQIRHRLVQLATEKADVYTAVLMQGSGTFGVESVLGSSVSPGGKLLIISNGAYGARMIRIAQVLRLSYVVYEQPETSLPEVEAMARILEEDDDITHVAIVHCETATGILNPVKELFHCARHYGKITIVDAMSSFGGIPMDLHEWNVDFLISSANKCIQGVPGFSFVIANRNKLEACEGLACSLSLDLYDQWATMEKGHGKWRFTSPTHVVHAFLQALKELEEEGGVAIRYIRYVSNQKTLVGRMRQIGFQTLLPDELHSPIITSFLSPESEKYSFEKFYGLLKENGFVIYPGKVTRGKTFRIGNIGEVYSQDIVQLTKTIEKVKFW